MTDHLEAGDFAVVDADQRVVRGKLLPFNETSRLSVSGAQPISFAPGTVAVPGDFSALNANRHHDRYDPVARFVGITTKSDGIYADFQVARTPGGDELLAGRADGKKWKLSPELRNIRRDPANPTRGIAADLTGAGFVDDGAFASAALFAADPEVEVEPIAPDDPEAETTEETSKAPDGSTVTKVTTTKTETAADGTVTTTETVTTVTSETPADEPADPEKEPAVGNATVPETMNAGAPASTQEPSANAVFEALRAARSPQGSPQAENMLAALADVKVSGTGALPANGVLQPKWLGEVWGERTYTRRYFGLIKNGPLTNIDEKGFTLNSDELVQKWAGNKSDVPTGTGQTALLSSVFQRWAFAVDIAREFFDIPGNGEVIEAFIKRIVNSYARVTDRWVLQQLIASAGTAVAADTFPSGYNPSIGKVLQVLDLINDSDVDATSIVVAADVHKELLYTPKDLIPEYVTLSVGIGDDDGSAPGVVIKRDKFGDLAPGQVLGVAREAAHVNELGGGSPILLDALDIARGGVDKGAVGYTQYMTEYPEGLVLIGNAASAG
jgi:hypothetical protein